MRYHDIITEGRMKEIALLLSDLNDLGTAKATPSVQYGFIILHFTIDGETGHIVIRPKGTGEAAFKTLRQRIYAAAIATMGGKRPNSFDDAVKTITGTIGKQAIRILTNPDHMSVTKIVRNGA